MGRLILLALVAIIVMGVARMFSIFRQPKSRSEKRSDNAKNASSNDAALRMVKCVKCGVFVPVSDARLAEDGYHCADSKCQR